MTQLVITNYGTHVGLEIRKVETPETEAPRGVAPRILIDQIRNTAPFLLDPLAAPSGPRQAHLERIREIAAQVAETPELSLSHFDYFQLCLSAHHATVATFVPTDVDNQIRFRLWHPTLDSETLGRMADLVLESRLWDFRGASQRWIAAPGFGGPEQPEALLSGHHGEWYSTAAGAYCALRKRDPERAAEIGAAIVREIHREQSIYQEFRKTRDGISALKAATAIAHNLGDLRRVFEMWKLPEDDALWAPSAETGLHAEIAALNRMYMADENHRHFALRKTKSLRRSPDLMLPFGPFFDGWGTHVAKSPALSPEEVADVAETLIDGWEWLCKNGPKKQTQGYARALAGIIEAFPGGMRALEDRLPAKVARTLKAGALRTLISVPRRRFEEQWNQYGLKKV